MVNRVLYHLARLGEIPFIVVAMLAAWLWLGSWLAIPVGIGTGRALYWSIKLGISASTIGAAWGKCWAEMIRLEVTKVSIGGNRIGAALVYYPLGMIVLVIGAFTDSELMIGLGFSIAVWVGLDHMFTTMPAAVLFLGRSSPETNDFLMELRLRVFPLRMTSLLDARNLSKKLSLRQRLGDYDNVRVDEADDWLEVVTRLATITSILILDCRQDSDAVADEIKLLKNPVFAAKTLAIVGDDGRAAAIDAAIERGVLVGPSPWQLLSYSAAQTELHRICRDPESFADFRTSTSS